MPAGAKRTHSSLSESEDPSRHPDPEPELEPEPEPMDAAPESHRPKRPEPGPGADTYFRNLYRTEIDFRQLAREDPDFAKL